MRARPATVRPPVTSGRTSARSPRREAGGVSVATVEPDSGALTVKYSTDIVENPSYLALSREQGVLCAVSETPDGYGAAFSLATPTGPPRPAGGRRWRRPHAPVADRAPRADRPLLVGHRQRPALPPGPGGARQPGAAWPVPPTYASTRGPAPTRSGSGARTRTPCCPTRPGAWCSPWTWARTRSIATSWTPSGAPCARTTPPASPRAPARAAWPSTRAVSGPTSPTNWTPRSPSAAGTPPRAS